MQHRGPVKRRLDLRTRIASGTGDELLAVRLVDTSHQDMIEADQDCTLPAADAPLGSTGFTVRQFLDEWRSGASGLHDAALHFGRSLYAHLFENTPGDVARDWAIVMHEAQGRGLRLELRFPEANAAQWLGQPLAGIPFELLCDHSGFLFRRPGWSTVRRSSRVPSRPLRLHQESEAMPRVLVAWANVAHQGKPFPSTWFEAHDRAVQALADANRATRLSALPDATRKELSRRVQGDKPHVLLWIGHGDHNGSRLVLHDGDDPDFPNDTGQPVEAGDFANAVRRGGVDLALLWSCHGAGPLQPLRAGVAEALLDPNRGDVAAVLASFTAIEASAAADLSAEMIEAWASGPTADLEAALGRAREELNESELTWARPVLFLRTPPATGLSLRPPDAPSPPSPAPDHDLRWLPQLPPRSDRYVDRLQRLATLRSDLNERAIVVLEGLAGLGKTELALAHAHAQRAAGEAVAFVDVTGHRDVSLMSQTLGLLVRERPFETRQDLLAALHGRRWTLVLDNAEDLLDTDDNREDLLNLLDGLRATGEGFRAVVTSRHALTTEERAEAMGLRSRELQPLTAEEAREVFIATAGPRLPATQATADILDPLLQELGGIARAVVLMAGQLGDGVDVPELRQRLRDVGAEAIIEAGKYGVDIPETVDDALDKKRLVSALNLSLRSAAARVPESGDLFDALSAFPAGLAQELLPHDAFPWLTDALGALLEHHLVSLSREGRRIMISAPVRALAWRRWQLRGDDKGVAGALLLRLLDEFSQQMSDYDDWLGTSRSAAAIEALTPEEPNLLQAIALAVSADAPEGSDWSVVPTRMLHTLTKTAEFRDRATYMLPRLDALARQIQQQRPDPSLLATAWHYTGRLRYRMSDLNGALEAFAAALPLYRQIEDQLGEANILKVLGDVKLSADDLTGAAEAYAAALLLYRQIEARVGEANTLQSLGDLKRRTSDLIGSAEAYGTALLLYRKIEDKLGEANTVKALGDLKQRTDDLTGAAEAYAAALMLYRQMELRLGEANTVKALGDLKLRMSDLTGAAEAYAAALPLYRQIEARMGEANTLQSLGDLKRRTSDLTGAAEAYAAALGLYQKIESRLGEANTLQTLGDLKRRMSDLTGAEETYAAALPLYRQIEDRLGEANTLRALGDLKRRMFDLTGASELYAAALPLYRQIQEPLGEANTLQGLAQLALAEGRIEDAFTQNLEALRKQERFDDLLGQGASHGYLARIAAQVGVLDQAIGLNGRALDIFVRIEDRFGQKLCLHNLGQALTAVSPHEGLACLLQAQMIATAIGDPTAQQVERLLGEIREQSEDPEGFSSGITELRTQSAQIVAAMFAEAEAKVARGELNLYALPVAPTRDGSDGGESAAD